MAGALTSSPCTVRVEDSSTGESLNVYVHRSVLEQVPYFSSFLEFREQADSADALLDDLSVLLPDGCPCESAAILLGRLYTSDKHALGSSSFPVCTLFQAIALGKVADMLMLTRFNDEIELVARRLAAREDPSALDDPCIPDFLLSVKRTLRQAPSLPETDIAEMLLSASSSYTARPHAEALLAKQPEHMAAISKALKRRVEIDLIQSQAPGAQENHSYEPLVWLISLVDLCDSSHGGPDDIFKGLTEFFRNMSSWQYRLQGPSGRPSRLLDEAGADMLRNLFVAWIGACGRVEGPHILDAIRIATAEESSLHCSCGRYLDPRCPLLQIVGHAPGDRITAVNIFALDTLPVEAIVRAVTAPLANNYRQAVIAVLASATPMKLAIACQADLLAVLDTAEELALCARIAEDPYVLRSWATRNMLAAMTVDAQQFVCGKLSCQLGDLEPDILDTVMRVLCVPRN